jgi:hypothetical protein
MSLNNTIGIDKITLSTNDFGVEKIRGKFRVKADIPETGDLPIYFDLNGGKIEANSYYKNTQLASYNVNKHGLMVSFNPSTKYHPYDLISTGDKLERVINEVSKELNTLGIRTDINQAKITRADLTRNTILSNPFSVYMNGLRLLKGKRQSSTEYPDGFLIKNRQHQTIFYDKGLKLKLDKTPIPIPPNLARGEVRAIRNKTVNRYFQINTIPDLLETPPDEINRFFKDYLNEVIFKRVSFGEQSLIDFDSEIQLYHTLKTRKPKGYFNEWLHLCSIDSILKMFGSLRGLELFLYECGESRMTVYRNIKKVQELIQIRGMLSGIRKELTPTELLHELQTKLTA